MQRAQLSITLIADPCIINVFSNVVPIYRDIHYVVLNMYND